MAIKPYASLLALLLAGCTMGPDFELPKISAPDSWFRASTPPVPSTPVENKPIDTNWWKQLNDARLDALVKRIATENLDVQTATARLDESRAQTGIAASALFPQVNGNASFTREKQSDKGVISLFGGGAGGGSAASGSQGIPSSTKTPPFNVWQYGFDASWEIDLWGRVRRGIEAAEAQSQAMEEMRRGAELSAIAELVSDYVQLRGTQASLATLHKNIEAAHQTTKLAEERARAGIGNELDVADAAAQAATTQSQMPQLEQRQAELTNAIALLLGQAPGALESELTPVGAIPPNPANVPIGVPSELLQRRPDIRQAEMQLRVATAQIGIAKADFFPRITLLGDGNLQALQFSDLNTWAARSYSYGPSVSLPIFEGGKLVSTLELREAGQREAAIAYRKTVLTAFHEVDNALTAFRAVQRQYAALTIALKQNQKAFALATDRYKTGLSSFLDVLTAERNVLDTELQTVQAAQATSVSMVQLYKALGGGWEVDFPRTAAKP